MQSIIEPVRKAAMSMADDDQRLGERCRWARVGSWALVAGSRLDRQLGRVHHGFERMVADARLVDVDHVLPRLRQVGESVYAGRLREAIALLAEVAARALERERHHDALEKAERELLRARRRAAGLCERCGEDGTDGHGGVCRLCMAEME